MSRNETPGPVDDASGPSIGEGASGETSLLAETGEAGETAAVREALSPEEGDWLEALADRLREVESVRGPLEEAGATVEAVVEPLGATFDEASVEGESAAAGAGRRLGEHFAEHDLDASIMAEVMAVLSDLALERLADGGTDRRDADDDAPGELLRDRVAAANRRLLVAQTAAVEAWERAGADEADERTESLAAERDELQSQLERKRRIASQVAAAVDATTDLNRSVYDLAEQIDRRTENQAADVETVGEEASKLSATVEEVASMAEKASQTSAEAVELAEDGQRSGADAVDRMDEVDRAARDVSEDVEELQARISEIDAFVEVINDVADQTNLLALNASIEAARAGEAGSGFAVVADEIKDLAETSREEAAKVETMVEEIQADAAETRESLAETTTLLRSGTDEVESAIERMEEIVERIQETAEAIGEVSDASDDQAASAEEIAGMIGELDEKARSISEASSEIREGMEDQLENVELIASSVDHIGE